MIEKIPNGPLIAEKCRRALGSLHCELTPREKRVLDQFVKHSFDLGQDAAMFGSSDQIALLTGMNKGDVSNAISGLRRNRLVRQERANALHPFKRPMLYYVDPHALVRVAQEPTVSRGGEFIDKLRADTATWLAHANRCYPLQPDLIPPEPRLLEMALAEISRASVLAHDPAQNGESKPAPDVAGETYPPEPGERPGLASAPSAPSANPPKPAADPFDLDYFKTGLELGLSAQQVARLAAQKQAPSEPAVVGKFPTTKPHSWKFSNHSCVRDQMSSDDEDGDISPSEHLPGDARGVVGNPPTTPQSAWLLKVVTLLEEHGSPWQPPTRTQAVFEDLCRCMGAAALGNYSGWWWPKCADPETRRDVLETIATWKLTRTHPRHKPWRGGVWRDEFHRRQRARLAAQPSAEAKP